MKQDRVQVEAGGSHDVGLALHTARVIDDIRLPCCHVHEWKSPRLDLKKCYMHFQG